VHLVTASDFQDEAVRVSPLTATFFDIVKLVVYEGREREMLCSLRG